MTARHAMAVMLCLVGGCGPSLWLQDDGFRAKIPEACGSASDCTDLERIAEQRTRECEENTVGKVRCSDAREDYARVKEMREKVTVAAALTAMQAKENEQAHARLVQLERNAEAERVARDSAALARCRAIRSTRCGISRDARAADRPQVIARRADMDRKSAWLKANCRRLQNVITGPDRLVVDSEGRLRVDTPTTSFAGYMYDCPKNAPAEMKAVALGGIVRGKTEDESRDLICAPEDKEAKACLETYGDQITQDP